MPKIRTPYNYNVKDAFTDTSGWVSICEPNDGYTLAQLLDRHQRGLLTDIKPKKPIFHDVDHSSPDMNKVLTSDLFEKEMHNKQVEEELAKREKARKGKTAPKPTTPVTEEKVKEQEVPKEEPKKL